MEIRSYQNLGVQDGALQDWCSNLWGKDHTTGTQPKEGCSVTGFQRTWDSHKDREHIGGCLRQGVGNGQDG